MAQTKFKTYKFYWYAPDNLIDFLNFCALVISIAACITIFLVIIANRFRLENLNF
jgi:hypothetical protein